MSKLSAIKFAHTNAHSFAQVIITVLLQSSCTCENIENEEEYHSCLYSCQVCIGNMAEKCCGCVSDNLCALINDEMILEPDFYQAPETMETTRLLSEKFGGKIENPKDEQIFRLLFLNVGSKGSMPFAAELQVEDECFIANISCVDQSNDCRAVCQNAGAYYYFLTKDDNQGGCCQCMTKNCPFPSSLMPVCSRTC